MTLYGWGNPRYFPTLPQPTIRYFDTAPETRVVAHCHWHADPWERPTILALHGLNGSSDSHYMLTGGTHNSMSNARYKWLLTRYRAFRAANDDRKPVRYYAGREKWMPLPRDSGWERTS